jgi:hypothetical protein
MRFGLLMMVAVITGCGDETTEVVDPPVTKSKAELAREAFWESFSAGEYDELPRITALIEEAYQENPNDGPNTFLLAHAHFWGLGEIDRDPGFDPAEDQRHAELARRYFKEASELLPEDPRIPGWYAAMTFGAAAGLSESPDPADQQLAGELRQEAGAIMERGLGEMPEFFNALYGIILENAPAGSPPFDQSVEFYWNALDACMGAPMDRSNPDFAAFLGRATDRGSARVCFSGGPAPHNFEGLTLRFGDVLVKHGEVEAARRMYEGAKLSPTYATWRFADTIDARLSEDLEARAALYFDELEENDPPLGHSPEGCVACHGD